MKLIHNSSMKFLSIIVLISIDCLIAKEPEDYKLSAKDSEERWKNCGKDFLPTPSNDKMGKSIDYLNSSINFPWLFSIRSRGSTTLGFVEIAAFPISHRHVLTSSQVVLSGDWRWLKDNKRFEKEYCEQNQIPGENEFGHFKVPEKYLTDLMIYKQGSLYSGNLTKAWLLSTCGMASFFSEFSPLLLEHAGTNLTNASVTLPCLADEITTLINETAVDYFGFSVKEMEHHHSMIIGFEDNRWIYTEMDKTSNDRGGPLVMNISGKATVIGLKASDGSQNVKKLYFYDLRFLSKPICNFTGVCPGPAAPPATSIASEPPTTTPDPNPSISENPKLSISSAPEFFTTPSKPSGPSQTPKTTKTPTPGQSEGQKTTGDSSEDKEIYEIDNDFYVHGDFLKNSGRLLNYFPFFA